MAPDTGALIASIMNPAYMVRHYKLQRTPTMRKQRAAAIRALGLAVRLAFNSSEDFEPLLLAVVDGLSPRDVHRF
jgi:hypothetical protein